VSSVLNGDVVSLLIVGERDAEDSNAVKPVCVFSDDRWTTNRSITDVDWSPKVGVVPAISTIQG
jgi:hypothetical protein